MVQACRRLVNIKYDIDQFPDNTAQAMVDGLHKKGIKVVVDFHPFVSLLMRPVARWNAPICYGIVSQDGH